MKGWAELKDAFWAVVEGGPAERAHHVATAGRRLIRRCPTGSTPCWPPTIAANLSSRYGRPG